MPHDRRCRGGACPCDLSEYDDLPSLPRPILPPGPPPTGGWPTPDDDPEDF